VTTLRPLVPDDAATVADIQFAAFADLDRRMHRPEHPPPADREPALRRIRHLATTDPGGAWVSIDDDGTITGASLGLVREGLWGLSLLVVRPDRQSTGAGSALLRAALAHGDGARGGIILASEDPRALRAYSRAGFALRPVVDADGPIRHRPEMPAAVRLARWPADREAIDAAGRAVRGAGHGEDLPNWLLAGNDVLVHERGGFAVHAGGDLKVLAGADDDAARDLLRAVLARTPDGASAQVFFIDAANDWAVGVALDAGLTVRPGGATFVRGEVGPLAPYLPSGAYL
jgi:GNAT superfamily N-acetyltransferase